MAVYSVGITSPDNGEVVTPDFTVVVEVGRTDNDVIKVLIAVDKNPPTDVYEPWVESSKGGPWLVCEQDTQFHFHYAVTRAAGVYFVRARASMTRQGSTWKDWKVDDQRIEVTVKS